MQEFMDTFVQYGQSLSQMGVTALLGCGCLVSTVMLIRMARAKDIAAATHANELTTLTARCVAAIQQDADVGTQLVGLMVEMKDTMRDTSEACRAMTHAAETCFARQRLAG